MCCASRVPCSVFCINRIMICVICKYASHRRCLWMQSSPSSAYLLIHLPHSTLLPTPSSQLRLRGVIFMRHQDAGSDECQQHTHTRPSQTQHKTTFIAKDNHDVLFCRISFRTDPVNLFRFGFNVSAEKKVYCWVLHHIIYVQATVLQFQCSIFASFCFNGAAGKAETCQVYGCVRHCVKP